MSYKGYESCWWADLRPTAIGEELRKMLNSYIVRGWWISAVVCPVTLPQVCSAGTGKCLIVCKFCMGFAGISVLTFVNYGVLPNSGFTELLNTSTISAWRKSPNTCFHKGRAFEFA